MDFKIANQMLDVISGKSNLIYQKDLDGKFVMANQNLARILGIDNISGIVGNKLSELVTTGKDLAIEIEQNDKKILESGLSITIDEYLNTTLGRRSYLSQKYPYLDDSGKVIGLFGISIDITEFKSSSTINNFDIRKMATLLHKLHSPIASLRMAVGYCETLDNDSKDAIESAIASLDETTTMLEECQRAYIIKGGA